MKVKSLSAGIIVTRKTQQGCYFLLLRAYNYWDFPKGIVESGEDAFLAACREAEEEASLKDLTFPWGKIYRETEPYGTGKIARYYLAETNVSEIILPVSAELGRPEHDEYRWLAYPEARALLTARLIPILDWAHAVTGC